MNWYEICKYRYPKYYMTLTQLEQAKNLGLITEMQFNEIKEIKATL